MTCNETHKWYCETVKANLIREEGSDERMAWQWWKWSGRGRKGSKNDSQEPSTQLLLDQKFSRCEQGKEGSMKKNKRNITDCEKRNFIYRSYLNWIQTLIVWFCFRQQLGFSTGCPNNNHTTIINNNNNNNNNNNSNSVALAHEQTITTERPPLVGEISANVWGYRVPRGQRDRSLRLYSWICRPEALLFPPSSSSIALVAPGIESGPLDL
jgi:hypothetical protein